MTTGKNNDDGRTRADEFLEGLVPQVTEHLAERHTEDFDAGTGRARFLAWLGAHTEEPASIARELADTSASRLEDRPDSGGLASKRRTRGIGRGVAIDLGTVNTIIWAAGRDIVCEEPSAIALDTATGAVIAVGAVADELAERESQSIRVIYPLQDGVIDDLDATAKMLHAFLRKTRGGGRLLRQRAALCVPAGATGVERRAIMAALGARRPRYAVQLIDEPAAAAAGAGLDLSKGDGGFVIDVGGGTTDIAAVVGWRVVRARSLRTAGNAMDEAIVQAVRRELGLIISLRTARQLKMNLGVTGGTERGAEAVGLDVAQRTPRSEYVTGALVARALEPIVAEIASAVHEMLSGIPLGIAEDMVRRKIRLVGGCALLPGLVGRIETAAGIPAVVVDDPQRCVVRGVAAIMEQKPP